jgi:glycosyltransferase involved in cell wall biosynthesis
MKIILLYPHDIAQIKYHGSGKKILNFLKYFSQNGHKIFLAGFDNNIPLEIKNELSQYASLILEKPVTIIRKKLNFLSLLLFGKLNYLLYSKKLEKKMNDIIKIENPDILQIEFTAMGEYIYHLVPGNYKKILFNDEIVLRKMLIEKKQSSNLLRKIWLAIQIPRIKKYEINLCQQFDQILTITEEEKKFLQEYLPAKNIYTTGVGINSLDNSVVKHEGFNLLFIGNYSHKPNADTFNFLIKEIFPAIKQKIPETKLYLVGNYPKCHDNAIIATGFVNDLNKYLQITDIFVAPIRLGGGLRIKILEVMACGIPVITTSLGAEGIKIENNKNIIIANTKEKFIQAIEKLYNNNDLKKNIGYNALLTIKNYYGLQHIYKKLEKNYLNLLANK